MKKKKWNWKQRDDVVGEYSFGYGQNLGEATARSLKRTGLVAYAVYSVLMNFTYSFRRWLIGNDQTGNRYLPVESSVVKEFARVFNQTKSSARY